MLVLLLSIPFWLVAVATGGRGWFLGLPASVVMIVVPLAVASGLALREAGRAGLRAVWSGVVDVASVRPRWWWSVGLGAAPAAAAVGWLLSPPVVTAAATPWQLAPVYFALFSLGAIPEEIGWTGYATGPLVERYGILVAGLVIGCVWQLWHVVPHLTQGRTWIWIAGMVVLGVLARLLMVLLYRRGGSGLTLACAFHAMLNTVQMYPDGLAGFEPWPSVAGMLVVLLLVAVVAGKRGGGPTTVS